MIGRTIRWGVILALAAGVPAVLSNRPWADGFTGRWNATFGTGRALAWDSTSIDDEAIIEGDRQATGAKGAASGQAQVAEPPPVLTGAAISDVRDVLRFDIDPRWVTDRWSHVTTFTAERHMLGMRVPLLTGTEPHDLAGSLTYYFDTRHRLQRIVFVGRTGDERPLADFVGQAFGLRADPSLAAGLYVATWNAQPHNLLYVHHAPLVRADSPHTRFNVRLEVNQLDIGVRLSDESQQLLRELYKARGW